MSTKSVVSGYRELRELNLKMVKALQSVAEINDYAAMGIALGVLDVMLPFVPVDTGTLKAAQTILPEEGKGEAYILTAARENPKSKMPADQYVQQAIQKTRDFYMMGVAAAPDSLKEEFGDFSAWFGQLLDDTNF